MKFAQRIAFRYLWSRRSEAFITVITIISILGVAVGVMVLTMVMSIMAGFEHELRDRIIGTNSHIVVRPIGAQLSDWKALQAEVSKVESVQSVSAFTYHQALIRTDRHSSGLLIRGLEEGSASAQQLGKYVKLGKISELFSPPGTEITNLRGEKEKIQLPGLIVGEELARSLGLLVGEPVSLLAPTVGSTPFGLVPRYRRFLVVGTYSSGLVEYESALAYADLTSAQKFFRLGDDISGLEVRVTDIDRAPEISQEIREATNALQRGIYAQDWTQSNKGLWEALQLEKTAYFCVLLLIVVMASFSIISTLIMIVLEKRKDIAVLKTLGASSKDVSFIFQILGGVIGIFGTGTGLLLGFGGCLALREYGFPLPEKIFPVNTLPIRMEPLSFLLVAVSALFICYLATIYPARRASSLHPSDVLRYE